MSPNTPAPAQKPLLALTGGGTAGHVMPHIALLPHFARAGYDVVYIGGDHIEKKLAADYGVPFLQIATGKLRRYFSWQNFIDIFRIGWGFVQSLSHLSRKKPQAVFSKGGFVSVPVCYAAYCLGIPVITHESDFTPGLANTLLAPVVRTTLVCFADTQKFVKGASVLAGSPVRDALLTGDRAKGLEFCGFSAAKPVLLVMGGSLGAQRVNEAIAAILAKLLDKFQVVHITGKGKSAIEAQPGYAAFSFVSEPLPDILAAADIVVSRAGANSIFEFLALRKPMVLIPLEIGSRGDQVQNATYFNDKGWGRMLSERDIDPSELLGLIDQVWEQRDAMSAAQSRYRIDEINGTIIGEIAAVMDPKAS